MAVTRGVGGGRRGAIRPITIALGLLAFGALAALGALTAGWFEGGQLVVAADAVPARFLLIGLGLLALDFLLGGLRLHLWLRRLQPGLRYAVSFRTYLVNLFVAAISPLGAASGPAQLAVLAKAGVRPARGVAALLLMYVAILSSLLVAAGAAAAYLLSTADLSGRLGGLQRGLLIGSVVVATLLVSAILNPRGGDLVAAGVRRLSTLARGQPADILSRLASRIERGITQYRAALATLRGSWQPTLAACFGVSLFMLLNKCAIGFMVAIGLGSDGGFFDIASRHAVQHLFLYFSPSPGGSGLAEASVPAFMAGVLPQARWMEFALLWRGLTSYIGVAVGALTVALIFGIDGLRHPAGRAALEPRRYAVRSAATASDRCEREESTQLAVPNRDGT